MLLNSIFPDWALTLLLTLLLAFLTTRVLQRGLRLYRDESRDRARSHNTAGGAAGAADEPADGVAKGGLPLGVPARVVATSTSGLAEQYVKDEGQSAEEEALAVGSEVGHGRVRLAASAVALLAVWAAFAGAQAGKSFVDRCSLAFVGLSLSQARRCTGNISLLAHFKVFELRSM